MREPVALEMRMRMRELGGLCACACEAAYALKCDAYALIPGKFAPKTAA